MCVCVSVRCATVRFTQYYPNSSDRADFRGFENSKNKPNELLLRRALHQ